MELLQAVAAGVRRKVFCASLADVWDNQVDPAWRRDLFNLIWETRDGLDWLLLTKRPMNIADMLPAAIGETELWPCPMCGSARRAAIAQSTNATGLTFA